MRHLLFSLVWIMALAQCAMAATTASRKVVELSPETPTTAALYLTNVFKNSLSNDTDYVLLPGTFNVVTFQGVDNYAENAHMAFRAKTNITIRGHGIGKTVIASSTIGNFFHFAHCKNIAFEDLTIRGTRANYQNILFAAVNLLGTNSYFTFRRVHFEDHMDHAIAGSGISPERLQDHFTYEDCIFEDIGATNQMVGISAPDGTALLIMGPNVTIRRNKFIRCRLGIEFEGPNQNPAKNITIEDNHFIDGLMGQIQQYNTAGGTLEDVIIRGNVIDFTRAVGWGGQMVAMNLGNVRRAIIENNIIKNSDTAISVIPSGTEVNYGWLIRGNKIFGAGNNAVATGDFGINAAVATGNDFIDGWQIVGNYFTNTYWDAIQLQGARRTLIADNTFDYCNIGASGAATIRLANGNGANTSNRVDRNVFVRSASASPLITISSGTHNHITGNEFAVAQTAITDSGTSTEIRANWFGTNYAPRHIVIDRDCITNITGAVSIGAPQSEKITLTSTGAHTLANPNIVDGYYDGQTVRIQMEGANTVVFTDGQNVELNAATITLSDRDILILTYDAADSLWYLDQHMNNL